MTSQPTIAFFGATGGCASATLARALKDGYKATALARTPSKLTNLLESKFQLSSNVISNLTIVQGSISDANAVRQVLAPSNRLVDIIVSGIGGTPKLTWSIYPVTLTDPTICETATASIISTLRNLANEGITTTSQGKKPVLITISTTGISDRKRDVPILLYPLYHWLLSVPHVDKKKMEQLIVKASDGTPNAALRDFILVRPTLLSDGAEQGVAKVRAGWESYGADTREKAQGNKGPGPQLGWTIGREDVGGWIFEEGIKNTEKWEGKCVSLTY